MPDRRNNKSPWCLRADKQECNTTCDAACNFAGMVCPNPMTYSLLVQVRAVINDSLLSKDGVKVWTSSRATPLPLSKPTFALIVLSGPRLNCNTGITLIWKTLCPSNLGAIRGTFILSMPVRCIAKNWMLLLLLGSNYPESW